MTEPPADGRCDDSGAPAAGILLVAIDRLPCWMLPTHGCRWVTAPALVRLASRGMTFDRVILTGDAPEQTLADLCGGAGGAADWPLVRAAAVRGWSPLLVTDADPGPTLGDHAGSAGMGLTVLRVPPTARRTPPDHESDTALFRLCHAAGEALATGAHRLVILHVTSLGRVWDAPPAFRDAYSEPDDPAAYAGVVVPELEVTDATDPDELVAVRHAFAGQITLLDRCLERLLTRLPQDGATGMVPGWSVLVTGLRGLPLGLHGHVGPGPFAAFGELVHVPAILVDPAGRMAAQRWGGLVTPADLGATLLEHAGALPAPVDRAEAGLAGAHASAPWHGASLGGLFEAWRSRTRDRVIARVATGSAVATPAWHAVARCDPDAAEGTGAIRLYAKPDDYFELNDVASRCATEAERLAAVLAAATAGDWQRAWTMPLDG